MTAQDFFHTCLLWWEPIVFCGILVPFGFYLDRVNARLQKKACAELAKKILEQNPDMAQTRPDSYNFYKSQLEDKK